MRLIMQRVLLAVLMAACSESTSDVDSGGGSDSAVPDSSGPDAEVPDSAVSDSAVSDTAAADTSAADTNTSDAELPTETLNAVIGPFTVPRGEERTQCVSIDLGNEEPGFIRSIRVRLSEGSHHLIVSAVDGAPEPTPRPCGAFAHGGAKIFIAQQPVSSLEYPPGAGLPIRAHQTIGIEMHYINYFSDSPIDIDGQVEFDIVSEDADLEEVQFLFTGDLGLLLPARERTTVQSFHRLPVAGARVFALTSHTHQLGEVSYIERTTSESGEGPILHESTTWAEPPLDLFDPMLIMGAGEGFKLTCTFNNTTDSTVTFGQGFDDEMCFLWAYYLNPRD